MLPWWLAVVFVLVCWQLHGITIAHARLHNDVVISVDNTDEDVLVGNKIVISRLLPQLAISSSETHVALVSTSGKSKVLHGLKDTINREGVLHRAGEIRLERGVPILSNTLHETIRQFEKGGRKHSRKIYILLTNGRFKRSGLSWLLLRHLRSRDVKTIVLAVGTRIDRAGISFLRYGLSTLAIVRLRNENQYSSILESIMGFKKSVINCHGEGYVRDECDRLCKCNGHSMTDCYRVRMEFSEMEDHERIRFIKAYKRLSTSSEYRTRYDKLLYMHHDLFCKGIHNSTQFMVWHRWYLFEMENMLREIDCRITIPYWDWAHWADTLWSSQHIWGPGVGRFGGNGESTGPFCINTGPFNAEQWSLPPSYNHTAAVIEMMECNSRYNWSKNGLNKIRCISRDFNGSAPNTAHLYRLLHLPSYKASSLIFQVIEKYHAIMHNNIGGDMCTSYASYDPVFFLHHSFLDKVLYLWQSFSVNHLKALVPYPFEGIIGSGYNSRDFVSLHNQPHDVKSTYSSFGQFPKDDSLSIPKGTDPCTNKTTTGNKNCKRITLPLVAKQQLRDFLCDKNFKYNRSLLNHLDEYNL